jgi:hypothetical protein
MLLRLLLHADHVNITFFVGADAAVASSASAA